ncbi:hypothetical protein [Novosphingobium sp.]|uniref:hypothetical protein n=1 Tax=Novosphingobium sp. TaxID=1874826 RepID=UPI0025D1D3A8|nr:hypothetical protein [Novosphingobium sp.]
MKSTWTAAVLAAFAVAGIGFGSPALAAKTVRESSGQIRQDVVGTEKLWHLRAGLNVAALYCRGNGRERVAPAYAKLLSRHKGLLASAYAAEQRSQGRGFDHHLTQVYNRFALQRSPKRFCAAAADVADEAAVMDSSTLARNAGTLLARID